MKNRLAILGAGGWGTAISSVLVKKNSVILWEHDEKQALKFNNERENRKFLPGIRLHENIKVTSDLRDPKLMLPSMLMLITSPTLSDAVVLCS